VIEQQEPGIVRDLKTSVRTPAASHSARTIGQHQRPEVCHRRPHRNPVPAEQSQNTTGFADHAGSAA